MAKKIQKPKSKSKAKTVNLLAKKERIIQLPISKFIDTKFRDYAVYVLEQRGIPNFYDALTPVQRFILMNSPTSFKKTLTVVGKVIEDHYHHGNSSVESAIAKLARPFGNAAQLLEGDGFFGTEVSPAPAAARYTGVRLSSISNAIIGKYNMLTTRDPEGPYDPLWLDIPLGLVTPIIGIAVGYKSMILPRKLKDIQDFLVGKRKTLKPHFENFNGKIEKYKNLNKSWLISSIISVEGKTIKVREIPPIVKYESILKKMDYLINKFDSTVRIVNNSNTKVNIDVVYTGRNQEDFNSILDFVHKIFSIIVTETVVFVKDGRVIVYDSVEQYLEDFKWQRLRLAAKITEFDKHKLTNDLEFNKAKKLFIEFMLSKKREDNEITKWFKDYNKTISDRLERLTSRKFTVDELKSTITEIKRLTEELKQKNIEFTKAKKAFESTPDPTGIRSLQNKVNTVDLFEEGDIQESKEGIIIWDGSDIYDDLENE